MDGPRALSDGELLSMLGAVIDMIRPELDAHAAAGSRPCNSGFGLGAEVGRARS